MRVVVHIDRVVLDGFRHEERQAFVAGLQEELGRVFGHRETVQQLRETGDMTRLHPGRVQVKHGSTPQRVGGSVARCIGKEMKR